MKKKDMAVRGNDREIHTIKWIIMHISICLTCVQLLFAIDVFFPEQIKINKVNKSKRLTF